MVNGGNTKREEEAVLVARKPVVVYAEPSLSAAVTTTWPTGARLSAPMRVRPGLSSLRKGDRLLVAPWIFLRDLEGTEGWTLADPALFFTPAEEARSRHWLRDLRLRALLDEQDWEEIQGTRRLWETTERAEVLVYAFRATRRLRDALQPAIHGGPLAAVPGDWLQGALPAIVPGATLPPKLWIDFAAWRRRAITTSGTADDRLFDLYCQVYPTDSLEFHFPVWRFPVGEGTAYSLLGRGRHHHLLELCAETLAADRFLQADVRALREWVLNDIFRAEEGYWEPVDSIKKELGAILGSPSAGLSAQDRVGLHRRLGEFERAEELGLRTNVRSGRYE